MCQVARQYVPLFRTAVDKMLPFDLPYDEFISLMSSERCAFTGIALTPPTNNFGISELKLVMIDDSKGYTSGNVVASCVAFGEVKDAI